MATHALTGTTALVTGASRGFGRAVAVALSDAGASVVAVARDRAPLDELRGQLGDRLIPVAADVTDPVLAGSLMEQYRPTTLVLNAGAAPLMRPVQDHTWETFSRNWEVDVRHAFHWIREALLMPLAPHSSVIAMSSGAALFGSPLSGGYAGAKSTIRFITGYAAGESTRAGLDIRFISILPKITPTTDLGAAAVAAYARRDNITVEQYLTRVGPGPGPEDVGHQIAAVASSAEYAAGAYLLTPQGLSPAP
jgi:NAD(P)-dependent dehydrogenase (short-subunit alcohol dehydrogenase family)